jgi:hypothetical protein
MRRATAPAGSGRTRATAGALAPHLSQRLPEDLLFRVDTGFGLTHRMLRLEGEESRSALSAFTMTGHLTGERLA